MKEREGEKEGGRGRDCSHVISAVDELGQVDEELRGQDVYVC